VNGNFARNTLATLAIACSIATAAFARDVDLRPGKYAFTVTYEIQGERQNESRTATRCIRQSDLSDPENVFTDQAAAATKQQEACSVRNMKSADGKISYDADCSNRSVHVEGTLGSAEFAVVRTVRPRGNRNAVLRLTIRATRTRDCADSSETGFENFGN